MALEHKPFVNIGPGEFIQEELDERGWKQKDFAKIIGRAESIVNDLIKNKRPITLDTARLLSKAFGQSPQYWLNLYTNYQLREMVETQKERNVADKAVIYSYMPINDMVKKGWLKAFESTKDLRNQVKAFWSIKTLDFSFMEDWELPSMRQSEAFSHYNKNYAYTWYRMAKKSARGYKVSAYKRENLRLLAQDLHTYTATPKGIEEFLSQLANTGVKFLVLSHLPKTYIDGASFYDRKNPVIAYTKRYDRNDNFWFTLAHEIAHILLHLERPDQFFIDNLEETTTKVEREADKYASAMIRADEILRRFKPARRYIQKKAVVQCGKQLRVHQGIVVGVLQQKGSCERKNLNYMKEAISDLIPEKYWVEKYLN